MKRRDLIRKIGREAKEQGKRWEIGREGAQHTVYNLAGLTIPIPRHNEIGEGLAREIFKECEPVLGRGWWR
ncbi:hypothetical protein ABN028_28615 [Actinopolymorpha sp. B17G11]|uniref:hypothetical protein n=1 Tax=Actinopolymorpha sp. B17G11 TaxID=3160861 RepID=UPI0032E4B7D9